MGVTVCCMIKSNCASPQPPTCLLSVRGQHGDGQGVCVPRLLHQPFANGPQPWLVHHTGRGTHGRAVHQTEGVSLNISHINTLMFKATEYKLTSPINAATRVKYVLIVV